MARPDPKFALGDRVTIKFTDRTDFGTVKSRTWRADSQEWHYRIVRPTHVALPSGEWVIMKAETTGWAGVDEDRLAKA